MKMQKGICIESNENRSIYMTEDGQFLPGRAVKQLEIGEEGCFYAEGQKAKAKWQPVWIPVAAAVAVLLLFMSVLLPTNEAFAYVQIEINPSVELGIDEECRVISIRELNADGEKLISKLGEWKNHSLNEVLAQVISMSIKDSTEEVTITTVAASKNGNTKSSVEKLVTATATDAVKSNVEVHLKKATLEQWRESIKESVPVGQKINKFIPIQTEKEKAPPEKSEANRENNPSVKNGLQIEAEKSNPTVNPKKESVPGQEKKKVPSELPKKAVPQEQKQKWTPPGQEKKETPQVPKTKETPKVPKQKKIPPGQEKKTVPPEQEKNASPKGHEKKQEKTKNEPAKKTKKEKAPKKEKGNNGNSNNSKAHSGPASEKKNPASQKKNNGGKE